MNHADLTEALSVTNSILTSILTLIKGPTTIAGSKLVNAVGLLQTNAAEEINAIPDHASTSNQFWIDMATCFDDTLATGVTYAEMDVIRLSILSLTPLGVPGIAVRNFASRMALVEQARIIAATTFVSRQDVDSVIRKVQVSFNDAEEIAANNLDNVAYVALTTLHAAVINDLSTRARPLPRLVNYNYQTVHSALWIAQNLYQDPSRFQELIDENKPIHPLFMPTSGRALSDRV